MDVFWLAPAAWWGLAAIAIPVAIHLLTRQQTRRMPFPTLRFLHATRLAALRRRSIHDWPLLLVRAAILAAAVAALAAPVFVSSARRAQWQMRMVRAYVLVPSQCEHPDQPWLQAEVRATFASRVFRPSTRLADGLREAADWIRQQPPGAREVVVMGDLREGALGEGDLALIPPTTGVRFEPEVDACMTTPIVESPLAETTPAADRTHVVYRASAAKALAERISLRAAVEDAAFAEAALNAVVVRGVPLDRAGTRRVLIVFEGGEASDLQLRQPAEQPWMRGALARLPGLTGGQVADRLVVRVPQRGQGVEAAHAIERVARAAFAEDLHLFESRRVPAAVLAAWARPPQPDPEAPVSDEGDRRWLWGLALALIGVEWLLRRSERPAERGEPATEEKRVA